MLEGGSDLFTQGAPQVPTSSVYTIRPFIAADKVEYHILYFSFPLGIFNPLRLFLVAKGEAIMKVPTPTLQPFI